MSHIREIPSSDVSLERLEYEVGNPWLSINYSIDHPDVPVSGRRLACSSMLLTLVKAVCKGLPW